LNNLRRVEPLRPFGKFIDEQTVPPGGIPGIAVLEIKIKVTFTKAIFRAGDDIFDPVAVGFFPGEFGILQFYPVFGQEHFAFRDKFVDGAGGLDEYIQNQQKKTPIFPRDTDNFYF
jgi:hypothetical protein